MSNIRRIAAVGGLGLALALVIALPASASLTGPCSGSATIAGVEYDASYDTADNPIAIKGNVNQPNSGFPNTRLTNR